jgi:hypothetical protein
MALSSATMARSKRLRILRKLLKQAVLLEAGAAILFFGSLVHHPELEQHAARAFEELSVRGYELPPASDPIRIYPVKTEGPFSSAHAGGWRPGVISLRENPKGSAGPDVFLRHELMHEASFRTCGGKLPGWAEEAAAMSFSGELAANSSGTSPFAERPSEGDLDYLRHRIRIGARFDRESYSTLSKLVAAHGWPAKPCAVSEGIEKLVSAPAASRDSNFSGILVSLASGRVLEMRGDIKTKYPPGSLLKIPYAAALKEASPIALGAELAASDTARLLRRKGSFDPDRHRFLISAVKGAQLGQAVSSEDLAGKDDRFWRRYLGERDGEGDFPLEADLQELALMLRACLLYRPDYFAGLVRNGSMEGSTLYSESEPDKQLLERLRALAKTGTVADEKGNPLVGHLMVAWPADDPVFLAVFRAIGSPGAAGLRRAATLIEEWSTRNPVEFGRVRVRLLTLTPRNSWEALDECPSFERETAGGWTQRVSLCGQFRILSAARGSRSERLVSGVLLSSPGGQNVVLQTDSETYADAVMTAEAQELRGEARKALHAVTVWNGTHGSVRHPDSAALCDTTHCMVFLGRADGEKAGRGMQTDPALLRQLNALAAEKGLEWLPFSKGGAEKWMKRVSAAELLTFVNEPAVLDLRRERARNGEVVVHLIYPEAEESVPCEVFRNRLKLLSCPDVIRRDEAEGAWFFEGIGEGHGQGLSLDRARTKAQAGKSARAILADAYE